MTLTASQAIAATDRAAFLGYEPQPGDPAWLDAERRISSGDPAFWAPIFDRFVKPGMRILQVGAGAGYFTSILSKMVGFRGWIDALEIDELLATRAVNFLAGHENVRLVNCDHTYKEWRDYDLIICFCGFDHIPAEFRMAKGLLIPLTYSEWDDPCYGRGILFSVNHNGVESLEGVHIYNSLTPRTQDQVVKDYLIKDFGIARFISIERMQLLFSELGGSLTK